MTTNDTPTFPRLAVGSLDDLLGDAQIITEEGWHFATVEYSPSAENAARIVACVNGCEGINPDAVPDLLAALELVLEWVDGRYGEPFAAMGCQSYDEARAAIAKARGKE